MRPLVFITGASSGIGQALALRFHQAGWRLALAARRQTDMQTWLAAQGIDLFLFHRFPIPDGSIWMGIVCKGVGTGLSKYCE